MADTWWKSYDGSYSKKSPRIDRIMSEVESLCLKYDKCITRSILIVLATIVWLVVADTLIPSTNIQFKGSWEISTPASKVEDTLSRAETRTLKRVQQLMKDACDEKEYEGAVILGPQVHVNDQPYMKQIMHMCVTGKQFINPTVAFSGDQVGMCADTYDGTTRHSKRNYPIAVMSSGDTVVSLLELGEVCAFMHAHDLLHAQWLALP